MTPSTGARVLHMILESTMQDLMVNVPQDASIREIIEDGNVISDNAPPKIIHELST